MPRSAEADGAQPSIAVEEDGHRPVIHLTGDFDLAAQDSLRQRLALLLDSDHHAVVIDLTATTFLDSTVIGVLVDAYREGLDFTIRGASGTTRHTLELLSIPQMFPFED